MLCLSYRSGTVFIQSIVDKIYSDSSLIVYKDGQNGDVFAHTDGDNQMSLDLNKLVDGGTNLRRIGKLFVSNTKIAKGSNGTIVLEGFYDGRSVAVKRLVQTHNDVAFKEIKNLIASDQHPNIVRWYGVEHDQDFVYLSLERCTCNMDDLIQIYSDYSQKQKQVFYNDKAMIEYKARLESVKNIFLDLNLWKANRHPSPLLIKLMRLVRSLTDTRTLDCYNLLVYMRPSIVFMIIFIYFIQRKEKERRKWSFLIITIKPFCVCMYVFFFFFCLVVVFGGEGGFLSL
jgi:hypothetical protein